MSTSPTVGPRPLRLVTAAATLASGIVHGVLYLNGFSSAPVIGPLFLLNAIAGVVIAIAVAVSAHLVWTFLAFGFHGASLTALLMNYSLPSLLGVGEPAGVEPTVTFVVEVVGLLAASWLLARWLRGRRLQPTT